MTENENINVVENEEERYTLDPIVEKLLDAKDYTEKIECFELLRDSCDEHVLSIIAISHDIELIEGSAADRYAHILKNFKMRNKYETARLRS